MGGLSGSGTQLRLTYGISRLQNRMPSKPGNWIFASGFQLAFLVAWPKEITTQMPQKVTSPNMEQVLGCRLFIVSSAKHRADSKVFLGTHSKRVVLAQNHLVIMSIQRSWRDFSPESTTLTITPNIQTLSVTSKRHDKE